MPAARHDDDDDDFDEAPSSVDIVVVCRICDLSSIPGVAY